VVGVAALALRATPGSTSTLTGFIARFFIDTAISSAPDDQAMRELRDGLARLIAKQQNTDD
jgi:hypothetical protein